MIPTEVLAGTQELVVKIYPGVVSQVVEGLDSILRMPYGCFEQHDLPCRKYDLVNGNRGFRFLEGWLFS